MIEISILKKEQILLGFNIEGHALSRKEMENTLGDLNDMICNSVSVLSQSTVIGVQEVLQLPIKVEIEDGYLNMNISNLSNEEIESAQVLLKTFEKSLESLELSIVQGFGKKACSKYIKIVIKEVHSIC